MIEQIFPSPQVKRSVITSNKLVLQLPYVLLNDLRLRKFGNIRKISKRYRTIELSPSAQPTPRNKNVISTGQYFLKNRNPTLPLVPHFTRKPELVPNIP